MPVKTFLNCTMPALVNIRVGSLMDTSGDDRTTVLSFRAKKSRKADLISLTPLICGKLLPNLSDSPRPAGLWGLLSRAPQAVQKGPDFRRVADGARSRRR